VWLLIVARDPARYRLRMLPSPLEKASLGTAVFGLHLQHRVYSALVPFALPDLMLGAMFLVAFWKTR
jgi:hypothetical protein